MKTAHEGLKKHKCETCSKYFCHFQGLKKHIKNVHKNEDHQCKKCGKTFSRLDHLEKHIKDIHKNEINTDPLEVFDENLESTDVFEQEDSDNFDEKNDPLKVISVPDHTCPV